MYNSEMTYAVVSPIKNEEQFISEVISSMLSQSLKPVVWVIVDDASTDNTAQIVIEQVRMHPWIRYLHHPGETIRKTGTAEVHAFNYGFSAISNLKFDVIVKLDGDVRFGEGYFEKLLEKFNSNHLLGIASGIYLEAEGGSWKPVEMPVYHAAGASKTLRRTCFEQIGGFVTERGWDTVDEIKAIARGWKTTHFPELQFYHLRTEGTGMGQLSTNVMHGEIFYRTGGNILFFAFKSLIRMFKGKPVILAGAAMIYGYMAAMINSRAFLVTKKEADVYRNLLNQRLNGIFKQFLPSGS